MENYQALSPNPQCPKPHLWECSHKSGIVLLAVQYSCIKKTWSCTTFAVAFPQKWSSTSGSTPKQTRIILTGSDLDMICSLDILLPLNILGALLIPEAPYHFCGSTPAKVVQYFRECSCRPKIREYSQAWLKIGQNNFPKPLGPTQTRPNPAQISPNETPYPLAQLGPPVPCK